MPITNLITGAINPYLVYIKIALVVLAVSALLGAAYYVKKTFSDKERLIGEKAQLEFALATEKQRTAVALEQLKIWRDTVAKMNAAVKNIKIQSDTYITGTENEKAPEFNGKPSIPFILPTMSTKPTLPRYENNSSSRTGSTVKEGRPLP